MTSLFDDVELATMSEGFRLQNDIPMWTRRERLKYERESLGLYVSGHPLEEYQDTIMIHTQGPITRLMEKATSGSLRDRDIVSVAGMINLVQNEDQQQTRALGHFDPRRPHRENGDSTLPVLF